MSWRTCWLLLLAFNASFTILGCAGYDGGSEEVGSADGYSDSPPTAEDDGAAESDSSDAAGTSSSESSGWTRSRAGYTVFRGRRLQEGAIDVAPFVVVLCLCCGGGYYYKKTKKKKDSAGASAKVVPNGKGEDEEKEEGEGEGVGEGEGEEEKKKKTTKKKKKKKKEEKGPEASAGAAAKAKEKLKDEVKAQAAAAAQEELKGCMGCIYDSPMWDIGTTCVEFVLQITGFYTIQLAWANMIIAWILSIASVLKDYFSRKHNVQGQYWQKRGKYWAWYKAEDMNEDFATVVITIAGFLWGVLIPQYPYAPFIINGINSFGCLGYLEPYYKAYYKNGGNYVFDLEEQMNDLKKGCMAVTALACGLVCVASAMAGEFGHISLLGFVFCIVAGYIIYLYTAKVILPMMDKLDFLKHIENKIDEKVKEKMEEEEEQEEEEEEDSEEEEEEEEEIGSKKQKKSTDSLSTAVSVTPV